MGISFRREGSAFLFLPVVLPPNYTTALAIRDPPHTMPSDGNVTTPTFLLSASLKTWEELPSDWN